MTGMFAASKAGHDKGEIYIIAAEEGEYVYLVDGKRRPLEKPKKKNRKHIVCVREADEENDMVRRLINRQPVYNEEIEKAIGGIVCQKQM